MRSVSAALRRRIPALLQPPPCPCPPPFRHLHPPNCLQACSQERTRPLPAHPPTHPHLQLVPQRAQLMFQPFDSRLVLLPLLALRCPQLRAADLCRPVGLLAARRWLPRRLAAAAAGLAAGGPRQRLSVLLGRRRVLLAAGGEHIGGGRVVLRAGSTPAPVDPLACLLQEAQRRHFELVTWSTECL